MISIPTELYRTVIETNPFCDDCPVTATFRSVSKPGLNVFNVYLIDTA